MQFSELWCQVNVSRKNHCWCLRTCKTWALCLLYHMRINVSFGLEVLHWKKVTCQPDAAKTAKNQNQKCDFKKIRFNQTVAFWNRIKKMCKYRMRFITVVDQLLGITFENIFVDVIQKSPNQHHCRCHTKHFQTQKCHVFFNWSWEIFCFFRRFEEVSSSVGRQVMVGQSPNHYSGFAEFIFVSTYWYLDLL